ncbi:hypothetical protein [Mycetocola saprophilus]|uniref:hypothetical protein n=1 Tax=Mycetocola saprophilus TaxID=76636 RepID=UPI003BF432D0
MWGHRKKQRDPFYEGAGLVIYGFTIPLMVGELPFDSDLTTSRAEDEGSESFFYDPQSRIGKSRFADD